MTEMPAQSAAVHDLADEMGMFFKNMGVARAAGQMFGYLMVCVPREQSAGEISEAIGISLASVSTNARLLIGLGAVEPTSRRSDRKTFYRLRADFWIEMVSFKLRAFEDLAEVGRRIDDSDALPREDGLKEMIAFSEFWQREVPALTTRWNETRTAMREER